MWHEARKQERKIRGMMVDYKKRAERRREYYEKIKADPTQFIQIHGRPAKIHLDPVIAQAAETPATMMPWQGHQDNLIDRFDVRAHLDFIPDYKSSPESETRSVDEDNWDERQSNYERFRTLVQNDFLLVPEEKFLYQIYLEEQFGPIGKSAEEEKKKLADKKVAIGYTYEDSTPQTSTANQDDDDKKDSDSDIDLDVTIDVDELTVDQSKEMNEHALKYGMLGDDFIRLLHKDKEEADALRLAKEAEEEKAMYSGRKSRRERRAFREKKLQGRKISPPSYAARESPTYDPYRRSKSASRSRSRSPVNCGQITYITSFGDEGSDDTEGEKLAKGQHKSTPAASSSIVGPVMPAHMLRAPSPHQPSSSSSHGAHSLSLTSRRGYYRSSRSRSPGSPSRSRSRYRNNRDKRRSRSGSRSKRKKRYRSRSRSHSSSARSVSSSTASSRARGRSYSRSTSRTRSRSSTPRQTRRRDSRSRSKSVSGSSRSRSRSSTPPRKMSRRSKSRSITPMQSTTSSTLPPAPAHSYYRRRARSSSNSTSEEKEDVRGRQEQNPNRQPPLVKAQSSMGKAGFGSKKLTPQERLKRRMQAALNRQYKADKKAEQKRMAKLEQERQDREEELREMAIKLRRRERERRHRMLAAERKRDDRDRDDRRSHSRSRSLSRSRSRSGSRSRSRSRSPSRSRSHSRSRSESRSVSQSNSASESDSPKRSSRWDRKRRRSRSRSRSPVSRY